ncbi:hypothetical protein MRX96_047605 [Rhipicephalus microplus]
MPPFYKSGESAPVPVPLHQCPFLCASARSSAPVPVPLRQCPFLCASARSSAPVPVPLRQCPFLCARARSSECSLTRELSNVLEQFVCC